VGSSLTYAHTHTNAGKSGVVGFLLGKRVRTIKRNSKRELSSLALFAMLFLFLVNDLSFFVR